MVVVPKKDKTLYLCCDYNMTIYIYRMLNSQTIKESSLIPTFEEIHDMLFRGRIFPYFDLCSGY